jgi:hypothetical protein
MKTIVKIFFILLLIGTTGYSMEKKMGDRRVGYIYLPQGFMKFTDVTKIPSGDIQYSNGATIFTLNIFQDKNHTLETAANSTAANFERMGIKDIQGATINFTKKYQCLQIYGKYNNSKNTIVSYVFKVNGNIHLLTFEGPTNMLKENLGIAETYKRK